MTQATDTYNTNCQILDTNCQEFFCAQLGKIEQIGPCVRLTWVVPASASDTGSKFREAVFKMIIPAEVLPEVAAQLLSGSIDAASGLNIAGLRSFN